MREYTCTYPNVVNDIDFLVAFVDEVQLHPQWELTPTPASQVKRSLTETQSAATRLLAVGTLNCPGESSKMKSA